MFGEIHGGSAFSFLNGAMQPEELVQKCAELGIPAVAQLDSNNLAGLPRFYKEAVKAGIKPITGAEIRLWDGSSLPLIVETGRGYRSLCRLLTAIGLRAAKGEARAEIEDLEDHKTGLICLAGGPAAEFFAGGGEPDPERIAARLDILAGIYGRRSTFVDLQRHFYRGQEIYNEILAGVASKLKIREVVSNGPAFSDAAQRRLFDTLTCIRNHTTLDRAGRILTLNSERCLKSPDEMRRIFADRPHALRNTEEIVERAGFRLEDIEYRFPSFPVPPGETEDSLLRRLTEAGAIGRYGHFSGAVRRQIEKELGIIAKLGLAGYFLIVHDIVRFCRERDILAQGRGSAANSAVCYSLGITAVDPIAMDLLFERFLSEERGEFPDIDIDLPSGTQREEVIQYLYAKFGRYGAAMTSVVITYQGRSAAREVGKVLGFSEDEFTRLAKLIPAIGYKEKDDGPAKKFREAGFDLSSPRVRAFARLFNEIQELPRHLGQHPGGMVISQVGLDGFVPLEPATMPGRVILQWDKDDCGDLGIMKIDLLGLGMLAIIKETLDSVKRFEGRTLEMAHLPPDDPEVYGALQKGDTVGWFQVESRAQMSSLPRTRPACFYDLVVQVAIIRPGPIVGDIAAPYIRRRLGLEPPESLHPLLDKALARTLGVPLFQEQLLRMAMLVANFSGGEAEQLRRALGSKRSKKAMVEIEAKLRRGMTANEIAPETQEKIVKAITSFALYGFPESHAASFALISYASGYLKCHYPAMFLAATLNNPHAGFYSSAVVIKDAERHGLGFLPIDVNRSEWECTVEPLPDGKLAVRMGLMYVRSLAKAAGTGIAEERAANGVYESVNELRIRNPKLNRGHLRALARSGALVFSDDDGAIERRAAMWSAALAGEPAGPLFERVDEKPEFDSPLAPMDEFENIRTDLLSTGLTLGRHPVAFLKEELGIRNTNLCADFTKLPNGRFAETVGSVVCRQRPGTAKGLVFLSLEDETGIINVVVMPKEYERFKMTILNHGYLRIKGIVQSYNGSVSLKALWIEPLRTTVVPVASHNFH